MKRILIFMCLAFLLVSCTGGYYRPSKLFVNDKDSGLPDVYFVEDNIRLPVIGVLGCEQMGGEDADSIQNVFIDIKIHDKVFHYDIENHILSLKTQQQSAPIVLLSEQDGPSNVKWLNAEIFVDYSTLENILDAAGILVDIRIDWENERIYIDTLSDESGVREGVGVRGDGSLDNSR